MHAPCPCCNEAEESLQHVLLECKAIDNACTKLMHTITASLEGQNIKIDQNSIVGTILDPSVLSPSLYFIKAMVTTGRTMCLNLYIKRLCTMLEKMKNASAAIIKKANNILYTESG